MWTIIFQYQNFDLDVKLICLKRPPRQKIRFNLGNWATTLIDDNTGLDGSGGHLKTVYKQPRLRSIHLKNVYMSVLKGQQIVEDSGSTKFIHPDQLF